MAQLGSSFEEFRQRRVELLLIAPQRMDGWFRARTYVRQHPYPFPLLFERGPQRHEGLRCLSSHRA